jgi:hypothetical protein
MNGIHGRLGGLVTERGPLPGDDYALVDSDQIQAVVDRKTYEVLSDFARVDIL